MRLIDTDNLNARLSRNGTPYYTVPDIENAPTVDAVLVVRCKDCKYAYINSFSALPGEALCSSSGKVMQQDDFCSYGERKDGGADNG